MQHITKLPDDILYLVHTTSKKYKNDTGILWKEITASGSDQHPGAYFSLITKHNRLTEKLFPASNTLIFSRNLLKQMNYHINMCDNNGFITEGNTFFPWNLQEAIEKIQENASIPLDDDAVNYHRMNEVVFHDGVPMEYLCLELETQFFCNDFLPDYQIENEIQPNMELIPFYCFAPIKGITRYHSSYEFIKKFAELCGIIIDDYTLSKDEILEKIVEKSIILQKNRQIS